MPGGSIQRDRIDPSFLPFFHGGRRLQARLTTDHAILLEASSSHYSIDPAGTHSLLLLDWLHHPLPVDDQQLHPSRLL
ncbi:hypothetical protein BAE44_0006960 [Dichanthelium oligosanthes]|uniref:Uncharacterized protein n=1 Tax=Dichanthelium oligosanthes TaxID=888268 RepID=A0A1E5W3P4_9POAL|nr:hypothetical protein BAE44_0006960 [Dichanthelium oligosanthes]